MTLDINKLVAAYIELRDEKAAIQASVQGQLDKINLVMNKIEAKLLTHFNETGQQSAATPSGTAYKTLRTSITVADWDSTLPWIRANDMWHMLERRVSKTAVEEYRGQSNGALPPGLNLYEELTVNIRRS